NPGATTTFKDAAGAVYSANRITPPGTSSDVWVYRVVLPGTASVRYENTNAQSSLQSFVVYPFYMGTGDGKSSTGKFTTLSGYNDIQTLTLNIPTDVGSRDLKVTVPISELTNDGRALKLTATAGGVSSSVIIRGPDTSLGNCCLAMPMVTLANVPATATSVTITIDTRNGQVVSGVDGQSYVIAGALEAEVNCAKAKIGDYVWEDRNRNGQQDSGEPGIPNVQVKLLDTSNNTLSTTTTDGSGMYMFGNLQAGTYKVMFTTPSGYVPTLKDQGSDTSDSDNDPTTGMTGTYTLVNGQENKTVDAGFYKVADLELVKVVDNANPVTGGTVNFTISVTNKGPAQATGVEVKDLLPTNLVYQSATASQGAYTNGTGIWTVGTLNVNQTATLQIRATANGTAKNCAEITKANEFDPDSTPNNYSNGTGPNEDDDDCKDVGPVNKIDLELTKAVSATSANIGQNVTWTVTLVNKGPNAATGVTVRENVPAGTTFVSATPSRGSYNQATGIWTVGNVAVNETLTLALVTTVQQTGSITNYAEVNAANEMDVDSTPGNGSTNEDDDDTKSLNGTGKIDLELTKTVNNSTPNFNDNVTFTVTVRNVGQIVATGVEVSDVLPVGLQYVSAAASQGSYANASGIWTIGGMAVNASVNLQIVAKVVTTSPVTNYAQVSKANEMDVDSTPGNNSTNEDDDDQVTLGPKSLIDLELTKLTNKTTANVGDTVEFTVSVVNKGPNTATGVSVEDLLPNGMSFSAATPSQGSYNNATGLWTVGTLNANATATLLIRTIANATAKNCAQVKAADQADVDSTPNNFNSVTETPNEDDDDCKSVTVAPKIDLELTKTVNNPSPVAGNNVTFTITVTNKGPSAATGVNVKDLLPNGLTFVSASPSIGNYNNATGVWSIGNVAVNATPTLSITATATGNPSMATNCAEVSSATEVDADSTPNNASATHEDDDACAKVTTSPQRIDLELTKTVSNANPTIGGTVSFTLTVVNKGPQNATGVAIDDVLPGGFQYVSNSGGYNPTTGLWTIGNLNVNQTATLTITGTATGTPNTVRNCAEVGTAEQLDTDSTPRNNVQTEDDYACAQFTVQPRIDLEVNKVSNTNSVPVGGEASFTITVVNKGPSEATGVVLKDLLPATASFVAASASQGSYVNTSGLWTVGNLAINGSATLLLTAKINSTTNNCVEVNAANQTDTDSTPNNNSTTEDDDACATVSTTPVIDLELTKTANTTTPVIGQNVTFTISVVNKGPSNATGVTVSDVLPTGLQFVSANPAAAYNAATGAWTIGNVAVNQTVTLQIVAKPTTTEQVRNYAQVATANETDIDSTPGNNSNTEDDDDAVVLSTRPQIDLELTKTVNTTSPQLGGTVTFTISVVNKGPAPATNVTVSDQLPTGLTFVSASGVNGSYNNTTGIWSIGNIAVNQVVSLQITATVNTTNLITNYAQVNFATETDIDSTPGNNSTTEDDDDQVTIQGAAKIDLELTKTVNTTAPNINDNVTFTVTVVNKGPNNGTGIEVRDVLPAGLQFVSSAATQGSYVASTGIWAIGNLAVNQTVQLQIVAKVTTTNTVINYAQVNKANEQDIDSTPGNNSTTEDDDDQVTLSGKSVIDLELTKSVNTTTPSINGDVTYTITVINKGPSNATGVTVSDLLALGQTFKSATATQGAYTSATGSWNIGSLAVGQSVRLDIVTTVTTTDPIRNYAQVATANETDIDSTPGNNSNTEDDDDAVVIQAAKKIDLELTKSVNNNAPIVGQNVIFTLSLINKGPSDATGVAVKDVLPA
ncbi:MAG TPA: SdrD B-like domain-containing protein, partial [Rhodothermales bacterium]|nr:SdrD B-like domain-containing protein [Rhodothermales bacterium]